MSKIKNSETIETIINGVRVINFPKQEGAVSRQAVESIICAIPELIRNPIVIDYDKISPEIFKPIKAWFHEVIENGMDDGDESYPIVCVKCFGQLKLFHSSETHDYDPGTKKGTLILHDIPMKKCQSCSEVMKANSLTREINQLLDDFFLFHLNGKIEIPKETDLDTLRKFRGASNKVREFREKVKEAENEGASLSAIDFLTS